MNRRAPFDQKPRQTSLPERLQHGSDIGPAVFVRRDAFDRYALRGKRSPPRGAAVKMIGRVIACGADELRGDGHSQVRIQNDPQRGAVLQPRQAAGELRIVGENGSDADQDCIMARAQQMAVTARALPR